MGTRPCSTVGLMSGQAALGLRRYLFLIPMKASPRLAESGKNPQLIKAFNGEGLGGWSRKQMPLGEGWQLFLPSGSWSPTRDVDLCTLLSGAQPPSSVPICSGSSWDLS